MGLAHETVSLSVHLLDCSHLPLSEFTGADHLGCHLLLEVRFEDFSDFGVFQELNLKRSQG